MRRPYATPRVRNVIEKNKDNLTALSERPNPSLLTDLIDSKTNENGLTADTNNVIKPPPSRGASHTRTKELRSYVAEVLGSPSLTQEAAKRRFTAIVSRTQANSLCARRFRSLLHELKDDGAGQTKKKGTDFLTAQEAIYYKSIGGLIRGANCRLAAIAINNHAMTQQVPTAPSAVTTFTRKQLCAMIMRMSQNDIQHAAVEVAQLAPMAFLAELKDDQLQVAAPSIIQGLSQNIRPQDHDLRARALLHLWSKDAVYRGLWNWYHIDATQSDDRI